MLPSNVAPQESICSSHATDKNGQMIDRRLPNGNCASRLRENTKSERVERIDKTYRTCALGASPERTAVKADGRSDPESEERRELNRRGVEKVVRGGAPVQQRGGIQGL